SWLLNLLYLVTLLLLSPWLLYRMLRTHRYRRGLAAKLLGRHGLQNVSGCVWFHAVSVGEVQLLRPVLAAFRNRHPNLPVVVSTTTETGFDAAQKCFPTTPVIFFPFDFSWAVRHALADLQPTLVVLAEGELWPNFLTAARAQHIPVAVINGRMSP